MSSSSILKSPGVKRELKREPNRELKREPNRELKRELKREP